MIVRRARGALIALACVVFLSASTDVANAVAPSKDAVTLYRLPRVLPTGGTGPLAVDPRGNVWFDGTYEEAGEGGEPRHPGQIVRMTRDGQITVVAMRKRAQGFAAAADGSVWFSGFRGIGRIGPDGTLSEFPLPNGEVPGERVTFDEGPIVLGADGNVWFSGSRGIREEDGSAAGTEKIIGRFTPAGELEEFALPGRGGYPTRLAAGPDGNVWFTESIEDRVGRITPQGQIQEFPLSLSSRPGDIAAGPDGALWFMAEHDDFVAVGRITTSGAVTEFPLGGGEGIFAGTIAAGPDGRLWFVTEQGAVGRIGPRGRVSKVVLPQSTSVEALAVGPEGSVWYTSAAEPPCLPGDSVCGQGGYYQSGIIGRIDPAPLSIALAGGRAVARAHRVKLRLTCLDGSASSTCKGRIRLSAKGALAGGRSYKLATDSSRPFTLRLKAGARAKLLRAGHLRLKAAVTLRGGRTARKSLRLRLRP